jgi:hypothetical protein
MINLLKKLKELALKYQVILGGLLGIALPVPFAWELFKHGSLGKQPVEIRACFVGFAILVTVIWFLTHCLTKDKIALRPKWWGR